MAKTKIVLEEGMLFSIKLNENAWTLGQLCNLFKIEGKRAEQYTLAFFNYLFSSEAEIKEELQNLDLSKPIIILTINGNPIKNYGLDIIATREINYQNVPNYKSEISQSLGLYRNKSQDFDHILKTFFGFHPWDGFYKENYVDEVLTQGTVKRKDVKHLKDFSIEELKQIMPTNSIKLKQILENQ
ncbi:hypothetical protein KO02_15160 [Sphingobacterium sp. ML3W]|uniref:hypothetical protein n=1 Tax=Sphingobacterium sp. ML3W TaxID=1538644 RepID=UPI0004F79D94|nr:hypothetical protein [Sphingobacterium sp. ML3W]AIM37876.1 hypothetical protein KO02_15160 [Sphingobacterium sp. ML3W]